MPTYTIVEMDHTNGIATWDTSFATLEDAIDILIDTKRDESRDDPDLRELVDAMFAAEWQQIGQERWVLRHDEGEVWITKTTGEFS